VQILYSAGLLCWSLEFRELSKDNHVLIWLHELVEGLMKRGSAGGKRGRESADGSQMVKPLASLLAGRGRASCRPLLVLALALLSALPASGFLGVECAVVAWRRTGGGVGAVRGGQVAASGPSAGPVMHLRPPPDPVCASMHAPPCCAHACRGECNAGFRLATGTHMPARALSCACRRALSLTQRACMQGDAPANKAPKVASVSSTTFVRHLPNVPKAGETPKPKPP
jgi:hypothetical protein